MRLDQAVARCAYVVDRSLKKNFTDSYDKRCMYAASGMHYLLEKMGHSSVIVAGGFIGVAFPKNNNSPAFLTFDESEYDFAHYWCETDGYIVDLGPMYLTTNSVVPMAMAPLVMWPVEKQLPMTLHYETKFCFMKNFETPDVWEGLDKFICTCERIFSNLIGQPKKINWIVTDEKSISRAARNKDSWACGTNRVADLVNNSSYVLPYRNN